MSRWYALWNQRVIPVYLWKRRMRYIYNLCILRLKFFLSQDALPPKPDGYEPGNLLLRNYLTDWCDTLDKPLVLLLDKVDVLYDDVLISTLRQLRDGFQTRPKYFPQSICLGWLAGYP